MARGVDSRFVRFALLAVTLLLAGSLIGCGGQDKTQATSDETTVVKEAQALTVEQVKQVETAVAIAKAIEVAPSTAAAVLEKFDMSAEDFENLMFEISANEQMTAAYEEGLH